MGSHVNALEHLFLAFENNCVKLNADRPIYSRCHVAQVRYYRFWQYKDYDYAGIRRGSLEMRHQTTVGSRFMRTCCGRMLKFIRCMRNKLAGSSDVSSDDPLLSVVPRESVTL